MCKATFQTQSSLVRRTVFSLGNMYSTTEGLVGIPGFSLFCCISHVSLSKPLQQPLCHLSLCSASVLIMCLLIIYWLHGSVTKGLNPSMAARARLWMLKWKSPRLPFSLHVSREGAETGQLPAELLCPWLLGFLPAPSTHNSTLSLVLINVHTCWYICGHMHTQRHTRADTCAGTQAERDKLRVISAAAPVHKQPAAAPLMSCDAQLH